MILAKIMDFFILCTGAIQIINNNTCFPIVDPPHVTFGDTSTDN